MNTATIQSPPDRQAVIAACLFARLVNVHIDPAAITFLDPTLQVNDASASGSPTPHQLHTALIDANMPCTLETRSKMAAVRTPALILLKDTGWTVLVEHDEQRAMLLTALVVDGEKLIPPRPTSVPVADLTKRLASATVITANKSKSSSMQLSQFLWTSLRAHRVQMSEIVLASAMLQILGLIGPLMFQLITDKVLVHQSTQTLALIIGALVVIALLELTLGIARGHLMQQVGERINLVLGSATVRHLFALPLSYFETRRASEVAGRVRELESVSQFLMGGLMTLCLDMVFTVLIIGMLFVYSGSVAMLVLGTVIVFFIAAWLLGPRLKEQQASRQASATEVQSLLIDKLLFIREIKGSALEAQAHREWRDAWQNYLVSSAAHNQSGKHAQEILTAGFKVGAAAVVGLSAWKAMHQELTIGMFFAVIMLTNRVAQPAVRLSSLWLDLAQLRGAWSRLREIHDQRTEHQGRRPSTDAVLRGGIELIDVCFGFGDSSDNVLHQINLRILPGERVAIVGLPGSGKSTLAKLCEGLYAPRSGRILLDGRNIAGLDTFRVRRHIAVLEATPTVFDATVHYNIATTSPESPPSMAIRAAVFAGLHDIIERLPDGYATSLSSAGGVLSHGQRQRLAIARAIYTDPKIVVVDEGTSALDQLGEAEVLDALSRRGGTRTVLVITHRLRALQAVDRIIVLQHGRVVEDGSYDVLMSQGGALSEMHQYAISREDGA
jgi:subfamily B ATP-binding cassette protein HlyB/CyaB